MSELAAILGIKSRNKIDLSKITVSIYELKQDIFEQLKANPEIDASKEIERIYGKILYTLSKMGIIAIRYSENDKRFVLTVGENREQFDFNLGDRYAIEDVHLSRKYIKNLSQLKNKERIFENILYVKIKDILKNYNKTGKYIIINEKTDKDLKIRQSVGFTTAYDGYAYIFIHPRNFYEPLKNLDEILSDMILDYKDIIGRIANRNLDFKEYRQYMIKKRLPSTAGKISDIIERDNDIFNENANQILKYFQKESPEIHHKLKDDPGNYIIEIETPRGINTYFAKTLKIAMTTDLMQLLGYDVRYEDPNEYITIFENTINKILSNNSIKIGTINIDFETHLIEQNIQKINPPTLKIKQNNKEYKIKKPVDFLKKGIFKKPNAEIIKIHVIRAERKEKMEELAKELRYKLRKIGINAEIGDIHWFKFNPKTIVSDMKEYIENNMNRYKTKKENNKDKERSILIIVISDHKKNLNAELYDEIKRLTARIGISSQIIQQSKLYGYFLNRRDNYRNLNTLLPQIIAKIGGVPWALSDPIHTDLDKDDAIYIGIDISREPNKQKSAKLGAISVLDNFGETIMWRDVSMELKVGQEKLGHLETKKILTEILNFVKDKRGRLPKYIEIHRDGNLHDDEIKGLNEAINIVYQNREKPKLVALSIRKTGSPRILTRNNGKICKGKYCNPDEGLIYQIPGNMKRFSLTTLGSKQIPQGVHMPLNIEISHISDNETNIKCNTEEIARHIYFLCKLNWSTLRGFSSLPITIHLSHKAANMYRLGVVPRGIRFDNLWML